MVTDKPHSGHLHKSANDCDYTEKQYFLPEKLLYQSALVLFVSFLPSVEINRRLFFLGVTYNVNTKMLYKETNRKVNLQRLNASNTDFLIAERWTVFWRTVKADRVVSSKTTF